MSCKFNLNNLQQNRQPKIFVLVLVVLFSIPLRAQEIAPLSVFITMEWSDKNGRNKLTIDGNDLCDPDSEYGAIDGFPSSVNVTLENKNHKVNAQYNLSEEDYMMHTWLIRGREIWMSECESVQIVFIPLFYCGNADSDTRISYIILYGGQVLFVDVQYLYEFSDPGYFRLNDDLEKKIKSVRSKKLRTKIIEQLKTKYTNQKEYESVFMSCKQS